MIDTIDKLKCTGCKMCADVCAVNAITFDTDIQGFWYPKVNSSCTVRQIVVENHAQDVVLKLIRLHITPKCVCHRPKLIAKLFLVRLNTVVHFTFSLLKFFGVLPDKVYNSVHQRAFFQQRHWFFDTVTNITGIHCAGKLIFRDEVGQHSWINFFCTKRQKFTRHLLLNCMEK